MRYSVFLVLFSFFVQAQEENIKGYNSMSLGIGVPLLPASNGLTGYLNLKHQSLNNFGIGLDLMKSYYRSPDFTKNPDENMIVGFDPETDSPYSQVLVNGTDSNNFSSISLYFSKAYKINKLGFIDFQLGPSLIFLNKRKFVYEYFPGFQGTFSGGGSPPLIWIRSSGRTITSLGLYLKSSLHFKINQRTIIEFAPYGNINVRESIFGLQIGFVFGKKYKKNLFRNK